MSASNTAPVQPIGSSSENLALLYQGILTAVVRLQSGRQRLGDPNSLERLVENLFKEIEREAVKLGYTKQDVEDADCVVAALLDETVQRLDETSRDQWLPLEVKMFPQSKAGETVFERLQSVRGRRESIDLADLLEVYSLCFLLGYEGRYAGRRAELDKLMGELQEHIERIRGRRTALSPEGNLPPTVRPALAPPARPPHIWRRVAGACLAVASISWVVLRLLLNDEVRQTVIR